MTGEDQMNKMVHLVCTRFSLELDFEGEKRFDSSVPAEHPWTDEEYLENRFEIFEKYTFSSLRNQTNQNFIWLVMFHQDTPEKYKEKIRWFQMKMPQFQPLYFASEESVKMKEIIRDYIQKNYAGYFVITTRIDNDDLVHEKFVEKIQEGYKEDIKLKFLSFVNGLQYDNRSRHILNFYSPNNHFISLFADASKLGSHVLQYNHAFITEEDIEIDYQKTKFPLWVEIVHENNVSNALHWRFSAIRVPYLIKDEYNCLNLRWTSKLQWFFFMIKGVWNVFWNRGKGLYRIFKIKYKKG